MARNVACRMLASEAQGRAFERKEKVLQHKVTMEKAKAQVSNKSRFKNQPGGGGWWWCTPLIRGRRI